MRIGKSSREGISWIKAYGDNVREKTDIGMNIRQICIEEKRGKKLDYYWCPHCNGFHFASVEIYVKDYDMEEMMRTEVTIG